jgi:Flp pilus assembly CpaE family ATPase
MIAVSGAKGSPGCSFIASGLAWCLAGQGISTLLVDADAEDGGLGALLDVSATGGSNQLARSTRLGGLDPGALRESTVQLDKRMWFASLGESEVGPFDGQELADAARGSHDAVVVDLGHRPGPSQQQLAGVSDWLLWVVVPDRCGLERADRAIGSGTLSAPSAGLVFNRIKRGCLVGAEEALSNAHGLAIMARIKDQPRVAESVAYGKSPLRDRAIRGPLQAVARCVHPDATPVPRTWP